ncbi:UNVERIFIED_CONTAM: hypothetical protein GTU68_049460 [Idotea baltica]|nr:hypothetical protein [Idotea baltica]
MTTFMAEIIGTMVLILLGNGVVAGAVLKGTKGHNGGWIVITLAWGLAVTMGIYAAGAYSGAHLNPAVTLGLAAVGQFPWEDVLLYITAQMIGAMIGAGIVWVHYLPHWQGTEPATQRASFCTEPAVRSMWANLLSEMIGTFMLVCAILFIGANKFTEGLNPIVIGLLVVVIGMSLGGTTGYAINPARDLGPRIAHFLLPISGKGSSDWSYSWIPVVGPILGGVFGALFYQAIFKQQFSTLFWVVSLACAFILLMAIRTQLQADRSNLVTR